MPVHIGKEHVKRDEGGIAGEAGGSDCHRPEGHVCRYRRPTCAPCCSFSDFQFARTAEARRVCIHFVHFSAASDKVGCRRATDFILTRLGVIIACLRASIACVVCCVYHYLYRLNRVDEHSIENRLDTGPAVECHRRLRVSVHIVCMQNNR